MSAVHLHAETGACRTECGLPCDEQPVAYRRHDAELVTCPACRAVLEREGR